MSVEMIDKKPRKAPVKKTAAEPAAEKKPKAAPKAKAVKETTPKVAADTANVKQWPSHEEIARLAHRYYEERGLQDGFHEQDWFRAEQNLLQAS